MAGKIFFGIKASPNDIEKCEKLAQGIEIQLLNYNFNAEEIAEKLKEKEKIAIHVPFMNKKNEHFGAGFDEVKDEIKNILEISRKLGKDNTIVIHLITSKENIERNEDLKKCIQLIKYILSILPEKTKMAVENLYEASILKHLKNVLFTKVEDYEVLFKEIKDKRLGICLDLSHAGIQNNIADFSIEELINKLGNKIIQVHVADYKGKTVEGEGLELGRGELNYKKIFPLIKTKVKNEVMVVPEIRDDHLNGMKGSLKTFELIKELL